MAAQFVAPSPQSTDPRFSQGVPGVYVITMRVEGVPLSSPITPYLSPKPFNDSLRLQGLDANVQEVKYLRNENLRDTNWAASAIDDLLGKGSGTKRAVADRIFEVRVQVYGKADTQVSAAGMRGLGAVVIGTGAALVILGAIAVVLAVTVPGIGKVIVDAVKFVGVLVGTAVGSTAGALAKNSIPILLVVGLGAAAIWMLRKGGASYSKGKGLSF